MLPMRRVQVPSTPTVNPVIKYLKSEMEILNCSPTTLSSTPTERLLSLGSLVLTLKEPFREQVTQVEFI